MTQIIAAITSHLIKARSFEKIAIALSFRLECRVEGSMNWIFNF